MAPNLKNLIPIFENEESLDDFLIRRRSFKASARFDGDDLPTQLKMCVLDVPHHRQITASLVLTHYWLLKEVEICLESLEMRIANQLDMALPQADKISYVLKHLQVLHEFYFKVKLLRAGSFRRTGDDMWLRGIFTSIAEAEWQFMAAVFDEHYLTFSNMAHNTYTEVYSLAIIKRLRKSQDYIIDQVQEHIAIKIVGNPDEFGFRKIDFEPEYLDSLLQRPSIKREIYIDFSIIPDLVNILIDYFPNVSRDELTMFLQGYTLDKKPILRGGSTRLYDVFWSMHNSDKKNKTKSMRSIKAETQRWLLKSILQENENGETEQLNYKTMSNYFGYSTRTCKSPYPGLDDLIANLKK